MSVQQSLQKQLAITPKTARLLVELGYASYRDLQHRSPQQIVDQLAGLKDVTCQQAETYRRGLRRMVWLATQDNPEEQARLWPNWTQSALKARGAWCYNYDNLTGVEANEILRRL